MENASLDDVKAWNEQLAALIEAGIPLDAGLERTGISVAQELDRINTTLARRVRRGETVEQALEGDEGDLPAAYRSIVQFGLHTGDLTGALDSSNRVAESIEDSSMALRNALVYPLVVCALAYVGLVAFCLFLVPTLEGIYTSVEKPPSTGLRVMQLLRDYLPYWAGIPPMILLLVAWRIRGGSRKVTDGVSSAGIFRWLPGVSRTLFQQRCASFADSLAELLDHEVPLDEALQMAGDSCGDAELRAGATSLAAAVKDGQFPPDNSAMAESFPPFLRWAIWHSDTTTGRARTLRIAAQMLHDAAQRRAERMQTIAPLVAVVLLGGTVTLLYGLALFVPVIEMLKMLAA